MNQTIKPVSTWRVVIAFAIVYLVWGSTYFFIRIAIQDIPPLMMACMRFFISGFLLLTWCLIQGEKVFILENIRPAIVSGLLLLLIGNGAVVWSEQFLSSSFAAVIASTSPIWMVIMDGRNRKTNFKSKETVIGLFIGFVGVILLFSENVARAISGTGDHLQVIALSILMIGAASWAAGSLYAKYYSKGNSQLVNAGWQMFSAGVIFIPVSAINGEWKNIHWQQVSAGAWLSLFYLISLGSLVGYSAYAWLLKVRPATQVSTHAYVNPVVAVLLGTLIGGEKMSVYQIAGLAVILTSVLLVNLAKYRKDRKIFVSPASATNKVA
jgi:drug/metabolite transporter (DMT)-like permease